MTSKVKVEGNRQGDTTKLVLTQDVPDPDACQIVSQGFTVAFDRLAGLLRGPSA